MATKSINTRIRNKIDNLSAWSDSTGILLDGEIALVRIPVDVNNPVDENGIPEVALLMKVGDGEHTFEELPWLAAPAADVEGWAKKSEDDFKSWVKTLIEVSDLNLSAYYTAAQIDTAFVKSTDLPGLEESVKEYTDGEVLKLQNQINTIMDNPDTEGVINSINEFTQYITEHGEIADGFRTDIDKNKEDIASLNEYKTANDTALAGVKATAEQGVADAATAQAAADKAQGEVDALETYVGTFTHSTAKSVVEYIDAKTAGIATEGAMTALTDRVGVVETSIATEKGRAEQAEAELQGAINGVAADVEELAGEVDAKAAQADLEALAAKIGDKTVAEQIEEANVNASNKDAVVLAEAQKASAAVQSNLDAHTGNADIHITAEQTTALNSAVQTVTAGEGLKATKTGTDVAINIDEDIVFILDCGTSAV